MLPSHVPLPTLYKFLDSFGTQLENFGVQIAKMDVQTLCHVAVRSTGFDDFGDTYCQTGLEVLLQSIEQDADLHFFGKLITRMVIINYLSQRLLFIEAQKKSPEIFQTQLNAPFIITGIPRSGTTFLHRMIAADSNNSGIPFWHLFRPLPIPGKKDRRKSTAKFELQFRRPIFPEMDTKHYIREDQEEECIWMTGQTLNSIVFHVIAPVSSYAEWLFSQDRTKYYQEYSMLLKAQQRVTPMQHLVLKAPDHTPNIGILLSLIPNVRIIQLHRDPATCVTSLNSLIYSTHRSVTNDLNPKRLGEIHQLMFTYYLESNLNTRCESGEIKSLLDIQYSDLVADPIGTVRRIYDYFSAPWSDIFEKQLQNFVSRQPKDKHGKHYYEPEQFGQSSPGLTKHFAPLYDEIQSNI